MAPIQSCLDTDCLVLRSISDASLVHSSYPHPHPHHAATKYSDLRLFYISVCLMVYLVVVLVVIRQFRNLIDREEPTLLVISKKGKTKVRDVESLTLDEKEVLV
ncbi:uncharacterized protein LOC111699499 isoform X2 [Eurytemora carolleeae]|uniref:uncharacterized protein LOC111699499 isoform X2 n=1 Tax=Eurytemora carolleeae TaxID=1294199 RepID=UPI000C77FF86|nr:uncharacterized protein LOC111699499 isoform X2 [Eurytemora carolleeae]|eukprot:XP_023325956.1 uncharacterized protein LOC111699499 isoform X2 [Eurytemora affinis]